MITPDIERAGQHQLAAPPRPPPSLPSGESRLDDRSMPYIDGGTTRGGQKRKEHDMQTLGECLCGVHAGGREAGVIQCTRKGSETQWVSARLPDRTSGSGTHQGYSYSTISIA